MAYKRNTDRLPIPPKDATVHNVVCHFCIVGCGYKAYSWPVEKQGGFAPEENAFGADLSQQQYAETTNWYAPSMYNIVKQNGRDVHMVIKPDADCSVNSGLASIRGARMGELSYSTTTGSQQQRLTTPLVWRYSGYYPTSWDDALSLVADVTRRVIEEQGEDGLFVSCYDHGGAGGGYENTWGTGKLYFDSMKIRNIRIHNRPAYNAETHASRDMGVYELNNAYEDAQLADTILAVGTNALETQTNYFLNHWIPNLRGGSLSKKREMLSEEPHDAARIVYVDPRRQVTVNACETAAGKDRVLHLRIKSGTDLALLNAIFTHVVDQGWVDRDFIDAHTRDFDAAVEANRMSLAEAAEITGLDPADIEKAAQWIAEPKEGGHRRRTMSVYEKGLIWGNDNYRTNAAIVNLALATGNVGRLGGGVCRMGGHQEGYVRPPAPVGRPANYIDRMLINGEGGIHHVWGCDHFKTTVNTQEFRRNYRNRTNRVKEAMDSVPHGDREQLVETIMHEIRQGGLFSVDTDIVPTEIGTCAHVILPAATSGEMNLTSKNGERRTRLTERYMDPPGIAKPDCMIAAGLARHLERSFRDAGQPETADKFKGFDWESEEDAFTDGYRKHFTGGEYVTYERLREAGTNGFQSPAVGYDPETGIQGTPRLYTDGKFDTEDGRAIFKAAAWRGLNVDHKEEERARYPYLINNGRSNHVWQSAYLDQENDFIQDRWPYPFFEMNPDDMTELGIGAGDLIEVWNWNGATQAMAQPTATARRGECFMMFGYPTGVQGNTVSEGVNRLIIPNYKQTWGNVRKLADAPESVAHLSFKTKEYRSI